MNGDFMRVSAVIPTKNRPEDLVVAVRSILTQSMPPMELIIIDQSSDPRGRVLVEKLFADMYSNVQSLAPQLNAIVNTQSSSSKLVNDVAVGVNVTALKPAVELQYVLDSTIAGLVPARAHAVQLAKGDCVMFFEDDVVLEPDYIATMINAFGRRPEMMGATGIIINYKPSFSYRFFHRLFHRGIFHDPRLDWHGSCEKGDAMIPSLFLNGGLSAYRRDVFNRVAFDCANGFHMVEDIEFSTRAAEVFGANRFFIVPAARLYHNAAPAGRHAVGSKYLRKTKEYILFFKKRPRSAGAMLDLTWLLVGMTLESMLATAKHKSFDPLFGMLRGLRQGLGQPIRSW